MLPPGTPPRTTTATRHGASPRSSAPPSGGYLERRRQKSFPKGYEAMRDQNGEAQQPVNQRTPLCSLPDVFIPEDGSWKQIFDVVILVLILYSAVIVPVRVCFNDDAQGGYWVFELAMSFCFLADVFFS